MDNFKVAFDSINFNFINNKGRINNIQFFVMWRELEKKWLEQGVVARIPIPDRELVKYFEIFDDFNSAYFGVSYEDFNECRAMIIKRAKDKRMGTPLDLTDNGDVDLERI